MVSKIPRRSPTTPQLISQPKESPNQLLQKTRTGLNQQQGNGAPDVRNTTPKRRCKNTKLQRTIEAIWQAVDNTPAVESSRANVRLVGSRHKLPPYRNHTDAQLGTRDAVTIATTSHLILSVDQSFSLRRRRPPIAYKRAPRANCNLLNTCTVEVQ